MGDFATARPLRIAIDLSHLLSGGSNGGIKPFIFEYVGWLGTQQLRPVKLVFLTRQQSHGEVRALARFGDELICLISEAGEPVRTTLHSPSERAWFDPPPDLVGRLGVDVLYCPFGECRWSFPGIPTLATIVDVLHRDYPFSLTPALVAQREANFGETLENADVIQVISEYTLSRLVLHYQIPPERMFCSPIAIHHRLRPAAAASWQESGRNPCFFYPANAWAHKNHKVLLLAYRIYVRHAGTAAWDLVLTGDDNEAMRSVMELASTLGISGHVKFLGHLANEQFAEIWRNSGALVFSSLHEGFGIPLVEAMAFGLPIVCSNSGALPEVGGDACLYADCTKPIALAEALSKIAGDPELRSRLQQNGRKRLESFSFERDARRFLNEIEMCAARPPKKRTQGIYADGWTSARAYIATSKTASPASIELVLHPMPETRRLKIYLGEDFIGQARFAPGTRHSPFRLDFFPDGRPLALEVPDATRLSASDHRTHGIHLASLRMLGAGGVEEDLLAS